MKTHHGLFKMKIKEHTMVIFNKDQAHHIFLLLPDATNEEEETKYAKILDNFIEFAAKVEQGNFLSYFC